MAISAALDREALSVVEKLRDATNAHDLEAIVAQFSPAYINQTPAHPSRGFTGPHQVRENWRRILNAVPDLRAHIIRCATSGATVWSEWEMVGTRLDGQPHRMVGIVVFTVDTGLITEATFYLEPVQDRAGTVSAAVGSLLGDLAPSSEPAPSEGKPS
ncbi:nuclear transport factor 2 family protein [Paeniglutamicibacter cryotolerans]|uniref:Limonene-1,2-epoxide hydrolase n=1 Tax=Paeniglutamicibacter cryotolerans TaxID=670079 RepID=A0A839QMG1_9MICC|nr:nuclear transport factor 2 family protein [Paeniglutamicibacter cryotolerans]MBB2997618.1 limonene-1,2-epoxide hydrolase [Paeniglutamicibacter cryotolerans]